MDEVEVTRQLPNYQKIIQQSIYVAGGIVLLGSLLSSFSNSLALVSPTVTYVGSILILMVWVIASLLLRCHPLRWVVRGGKKVGLTHLGMQLNAKLIGIILLLWLPRIVDYATYTEEIPALQIQLGGSEVKYGATREVVYAIPTELNSTSFIITYLQLQLVNGSEKTVEAVIIALHYPEGTQTPQTDAMRQSVLGEKEQHQLKRWTNTLEGVTHAYLAVDSIGPHKSYMLHEPIKLSPQMLPTSSTDVTVTINVSGKDLPRNGFTLKLQAIPSNSLEELRNRHKELIYTKVVADRKRDSFFRYLRRSISSQTAIATEVFPTYRIATDSKNEVGYISDALHDKWGSISYNPAPFQYLFH